MCYSALVEASYQEYCRQFGLVFDRDGFHDLYSMRVHAPYLKIPDELTQQLAAEDSAFGRSIGKLHAAFLKGERQRIAAEIATVGSAIEQLEEKSQGRHATRIWARSGANTKSFWPAVRKRRHLVALTAFTRIISRQSLPTSAGRGC